MNKSGTRSQSCNEIFIFIIFFLSVGRRARSSLRAVGNRGIVIFLRFPKALGCLLRCKDKRENAGSLCFINYQHGETRIMPLLSTKSVSLENIFKNKVYTTESNLRTFSCSIYSSLVPWSLDFKKSMLFTLLPGIDPLKIVLLDL
jgi:hypothetical protein